MKLIIDIEEELYEAYKGKPPMLGDAGMDMIAQAIANGTPYNPTGDLISREALKKAIEESQPCCNAWIDIVDNAPAVHFIDVFNKNTYLNSYRSYSEPEPNRYISRIDTECIMLECPECKSRMIATAFSFAVGTKGYSFCPYCGADMRKGGAE